MIQTIEATIDENGGVHLLEAVHLSAPRRALVTILEAKPIETNLEAAYREMAGDEAREREALEWADTTVGDVG